MTQTKYFTEKQRGSSDVAMHPAATSTIKYESEHESNEQMIDQYITWNKQECEPHKRLLQLILFGWHQPRDKPISINRFNNFLTHKWRVTKLSKQQSKMLEEFFQKIMHNIIEQGADHGDQMITHVERMWKSMSHDKSKSPIIHSKWWHQAWKTMKHYKNQKIEPQTIAKDKSKQLVTICTNNMVLYNIYKRIRSLKTWKKLQAVEDDELILKQTKIWVTELVLLCDIARAYHTLSMCSPIKEQSEDQTGKKQESWPAHSYSLPEFVEKWLHEAYCNKNGLLYQLIYNSLNENGLPNKQCLKNIQEGKYSIESKLKYIASDPQQQLRILRHCVGLEIQFVLHYPNMLWYWSGNFACNEHSYHVPMLDSYTVASNELIVKYLNMSKVQPQGHLPMGKDEWIERYGHSRHDCNQEQPDLPPPYNYEAAPPKERLKFKVLQGQNIFIHNLADASIRADKFWDAIFPTNISNHPKNVPLTTASKMAATSNFRPAANKLTHVKYRGWQDQAQQWKENALSFVFAMCSPDIEKLHGTQKPDQIESTKKYLVNAMSSIRIRFDEFDAQEQKQFPDYCNDTEYWKHSLVYPQKNAKKSGNTCRKENLIILNLWFGDDWIYMNRCQQDTVTDYKFDYTLKKMTKYHHKTVPRTELDNRTIWHGYKSQSDKEEITSEWEGAPTEKLSKKTKTKTKRARTKAKQSKSRSEKSEIELFASEASDGSVVTNSSVSSGLSQCCANELAMQATEKTNKKRNHKLFDSDIDDLVNLVTSSDNTSNDEFGMAVTTSSRLRSRIKSNNQTIKNEPVKTKELPKSPSKETKWYEGLGNNPFQQTKAPWTRIPEQNVYVAATMKPQPTFKNACQRAFLNKPKKKKGKKNKKGQRKRKEKSADGEPKKKKRKIGKKKKPELRIDSD